MLAGLKYIQMEAVDFEAYQGGCKLSEIDEFLSAHHFRCVLKKSWILPEQRAGTFYDVVYARK